MKLITQSLFVIWSVFSASMTLGTETHAVPVNVNNFVRAETDSYFLKTVKEGAFGKLVSAREPTAIDAQKVVRMNRDTLYSSGVFDLDAGPVTITLPDAGRRYMAMQVVSEDHYTIEVTYTPGTHTYDRQKVGTRYAFIIIRTLADPASPADMAVAHHLQDLIKVRQASAGTFEIPPWDPVTQTKARDALSVLGSLGGQRIMFGTRQEVDPVGHLIGAAIGWGGNPQYAATYVSAYPKQNDGKTAYTLVLKNVPVDGFWSVSVYNAQGYFAKNSRGAYSLNNLTAKPNPDGSFSIHFGGCQADTPNCLPIVTGWNYTVRLYRPRKAILDGTWKLPDAQPVT